MFRGLQDGYAWGISRDNDRHGGYSRITKRAGEAHGEFVRDRLPPRDVQLHDPRRDGLLETPLDERGLVDLDRLVDLARATVSPEFGWESRENDVHHLQWPRRHYDIAGAMVDVETQVFRNLVNRKAYVPRIFHNWVHYITAPPPRAQRGGHAL